MNYSPQSWIRSTAIAAAATGIMLALVIIVGEEVPAFKNWLKATFYHHWLGKGVLCITLFALISLLYHPKGEVGDPAKYIAWEIYSTLLSVVLICGYFLLHVLHWV